MQEIKYKKVWKDPGYCNGEFIPIKPLRGQVLNYWEMSRVTMPVRSYERYPVSKAIKNDLVGKEFGYDSDAKDTTMQYKKYLKPDGKYVGLNSNSIIKICSGLTGSLIPKINFTKPLKNLGTFFTTIVIFITPLS